MPLNAYDIVFLVLIALLGLRGLWRGLIREVAMISSVIGGLILARLFCREAASFIEPWFKTEWVANAVAFAAIFIAVYAAGIIVSLVLRKIVRRAGAGRFERFAGMLFGAFEGVVVIGIFLLLLRSITGSLEDSFLKDSLTAPYILALMDFLSGLIQHPPGIT